MEAAGELDIDAKHGFLMQVSTDSNSSGGTTTYSLEELSSPEFFTNKCSEIDAMASRVVDESKIKEAIREAVADGNFCVSVADPHAPDIPLIAVSEQFACMTGYNQAEILGKNCRFLNHGCNMNPDDLMRLRAACKTGAACVAVLTNRRKSGELFLNLLDLCGLTVAQNPSTGEELWFLVGIQADVTNLTELDDVQDQHIAAMHRVACRIRAKLADELSVLAVSGALNANFAVSTNPSGNTWCLLPTPTWRWTEGWLPNSNTLSSGPVAWTGKSNPVKEAAISGGRRALCKEEALYQGLRLTLALVLLGGAGLVGSLLRKLYQWY